MTYYISKNKLRPDEKGSTMVIQKWSEEVRDAIKSDLGIKFININETWQGGPTLDFFKDIEAREMSFGISVPGKIDLSGIDSFPGKIQGLNLRIEGPALSTVNFSRIHQLEKITMWGVYGDLPLLAGCDVKEMRIQGVFRGLKEIVLPHLRHLEKFILFEGGGLKRLSLPQSGALSHVALSAPNLEYFEVPKSDSGRMVFLSLEVGSLKLIESLGYINPVSVQIYRKKKGMPIEDMMRIFPNSTVTEGKN